MLAEYGRLHALIGNGELPARTSEGLSRLLLLYRCWHSSSNLMVLVLLCLLPVRGSFSLASIAPIRRLQLHPGTKKDPRLANACPGGCVGDGMQAGRCGFADVLRLVKGLVLPVNASRPSSTQTTPSLLTRERWTADRNASSETAR